MSTRKIGDSRTGYADLVVASFENSALVCGAVANLRRVVQPAVSPFENPTSGRGYTLIGGGERNPLMKASEDNPIDDDVLTDYSEDGVDLTLIRWMLSLTPIERLKFLQERINEVLAIRQLNAGNQTPFNPTKPL
jgi:hypothetical protein